MVRFIAFSGACFSGKTTFIGKLSRVLRDKGKEVVVLSENCRKHKYWEGSIDDIRSKPEEYLSAEELLIAQNIKDEIDLVTKCSESKDMYVLIDRALTDSLMYLILYLDFSALSKNSKKRYWDLYETLDKSIKNSFSEVYDAVVQFKPISPELKDPDDEFRPKDLMTTQSLEYDMIRKLNNFYINTVFSSKNNKLIQLDALNDSDCEKIINEILNLGQDGECPF